MRRNKKPHKGQKLNDYNLKALIKKHLKSNSRKRYDTKKLLNKLKVKNSKEEIQEALNNLERKGYVFQIKKGVYKWDVKSNKKDRAKFNRPKKEFIGKVDLTRTGAAYIITEDYDSDIYVPPRYVNGAMNRDTVKVEVSISKTRKRQEGKIVEIIQRSLTHVLGRFRVYKNYGLVTPEIDRLFPEVYIKPNEKNKEYDGKRVSVKITEYQNKGQNSTFWGEIQQIIPETDHNDLAMQSILLSQGFELEFSPEVMDEVKSMDGKITPSEVDVRRDFRDTLTITIDPLTAKDFDDAISYKVLDNGDIEIGVHIADVTHYLAEGTELDKEAQKRSTSVYLVDRVLPMLPEKLSNDLCSLNPHEDKYTFSAVFTFDSKNKITSRWFGKTIIHSDRRFTYEEAQEIIEGQDGDYKEEIISLNNIAKSLRSKRFKNGSINFESDEIRFLLDENNKPVSVYAKERKEAHMLIEDFMLLANKEVAKFIAKKTTPEIPFVYRVHDTPDLEKLADFSLFAKGLGYKMNLNTPKEIAASFNHLNKEAESDPVLKLLMPLAIRTMAKAEYHPDNIGHYGLAFDYYTHFTSPIRRYADVLVHRILFENLDKIRKREKLELELKCKHISAQEKKAADAERESVKYKQVEFLQDKVGQIFDAYVSGIIEKGIFVALDESRAEGLISFNKFDEPYEMKADRLSAIGKRSGDIIRMGDSLKVKVLEANLNTRLIEFEIVEKE